MNSLLKSERPSCCRILSITLNLVLLTAWISLLLELMILSPPKELSLQIDLDMILYSSCEEEQTEVDSESSLSRVSEFISKIELAVPLFAVFPHILSKPLESSGLVRTECALNTCLSLLSVLLFATCSLKESKIEFSVIGDPKSD